MLMLGPCAWVVASMPSWPSALPGSPAPAEAAHGRNRAHLMLFLRFCPKLGGDTSQHYVTNDLFLIVLTRVEGRWRGQGCEKSKPLCLSSTHFDSKLEPRQIYNCLSSAHFNSMLESRQVCNCLPSTHPTQGLDKKANVQILKWRFLLPLFHSFWFYINALVKIWIRTS